MALKDYRHVRSSLFIKIEVDRYSFSDGFIGPEVLTFSDHSNDFDFEGETYRALGNLLSVSSTRSELKSSSNTMSLTISGIPDRSLQQVTESEFRASPVTVKRAFFTQGGEFIDDGSIEVNPIGRFVGFINNWSIFENWDAQRRTSTSSVQFDCQSFIDILAKKKSGRYTNPGSMKTFFPNDISFDRVPQLAGGNYFFGETR